MTWDVKSPPWKTWGGSIMRGLRHFARARQGNVAMMFGLALPVLLMISLGAVDVHQITRVKANLQDALDAAALAAARTNSSEAAVIQRVGMDALKANMPAYFKEGALDEATFVLNDNVLVADAKVNMKVLVANIILPPYGRLMDDYVPIPAHSEVLRASRNVEVGLALDVTISMKGAALTALKEAAKELVDIVVQDQQTPFYSKLGFVPYASGVNLGSKVAQARGPIRSGTTVQSAAWAVDAGKSITGISKANPGVFSSPRHGLKLNDVVVITGVQGMTQVNNRIFVVSEVSTDSFKVKEPGGKSHLSTSGMSNYSRNGTVRKCVTSTCNMVIGSTNHGLSVGEQIYLDEWKGLTSLNANYYSVASVSANSFTIAGHGYPTGAYTADSGKVWCVAEGCERFRFTNAQGGQNLNWISNCVTERTGDKAYTDASPSTAYFGRNYPSGSAECPSSQVMGMSSSRATLKAAIDKLEVEGTTGGQIGIAWAWNLVSPQFASFWGGSSAPGIKDPQKTLKVVVLMTDGEFNSPYCRGVLSTDAAVGSLIGRQHLIGNCNATNGNPFSQAVRLCDAMKADGIVVYTVGFNLQTGRGSSGVDTAIELMETCATNKSTHFHNTSSGAELQTAFRAIGRDITQLRISR